MAKYKFEIRKETTYRFNCIRTKLIGIMKSSKFKRKYDFNQTG